MSKPTIAAIKAAASGDAVNALIAATPGGIEQQEAEGQRALTAAFNRLPRQYGPLDGNFPREALERLGFKIGEAIDDLWLAVTPPDGWTLRRGDNSYWSYIHDAGGNTRGGVFYKAAFYDQRARFSLAPRYTVFSDYRDDPGGDYNKGARRVCIRDGVGNVMLVEGDWVRNDQSSSLDQDDQMERELAARFPDHRNVEAYWPRQRWHTHGVRSTFPRFSPINHPFGTRDGSARAV